MRAAKILAAATLMAGATPSLAVDRFWNTGFHTWSVGTNWSPNGMPAAGDVAYIQNFTGSASHARIRSNVGTPSFMQISSDALVSISGDGVLSLSGFANVGVYSGNGTLRVQTILGAAAGQLYIGDDLKLGVNSGAGTLTVWAGSATIADTLHVGESTDSGSAFAAAGTVEVSAGSLNAMTVLIADNAGTQFAPVSGRMYMTGTGVGSFGSVVLADNAANAVAEYHQRDQSRVSISNQFWMRNNAVTNMTGGTLTAGSTTMFNTARINYDGGFFSAGTLTMYDNSLISMSATGPERLLRIQTIDRLFGSIEMGDNSFVAASTSFLDAFSALQSGYSGGLWNGTGIRSSSAAGAAATSNKTGLGYSNFVSTPIAGQTINPGEFVIRYTLLGDANLDLAVNISDFAALAASFNSTNSRWHLGDFNYDRLTNISDFALLAANFNKTLPAELPRSNVPEPANAAILGVAWYASRRVRSRCR